MKNLVICNKSAHDLRLRWIHSPKPATVNIAEFNLEPFTEREWICQNHTYKVEYSYEKSAKRFNRRSSFDGELDAVWVFDGTMMAQVNLVEGVDVSAEGAYEMVGTPPTKSRKGACELEKARREQVGREVEEQQSRWNGKVSPPFHSRTLMPILETP